MNAKIEVLKLTGFKEDIDQAIKDLTKLANDPLNFQVKSNLGRKATDNEMKMIQAYLAKYFNVQNNHVKQAVDKDDNSIWNLVIYG
jgi:hypothetical protein